MAGFVREADNLPASAETAALLPVGGAILGVLESRADSDWIRAELTAGASYRLALTSRDPDGAGPLIGSGDTVLEIYNSRGELVARMDDQPLVDGNRPEGGLHPRLNFSPDAGGVYYFRVSNYTGFPERDYSGGYRFELVETMAAPAAPGSGSDTGDGEGGGADDREGGSADDRDGEDADDGDGGDADDGDGGDADDGDGGDADDDAGASGPVASGEVSDAAPLPVGGAMLGVLDGRADSDWIRTELTAGASYRLALTSRDPDGAGPLGGAGDTVLEIYNGRGELVARMDDQPLVDGDRPEGGLHPELIFSPDASGVYYFRVSSYAGFPVGDYSGGYRFELAEAKVEDPPASILPRTEPDPDPGDNPPSGGANGGEKQNGGDGGEGANGAGADRASGDTLPSFLNLGADNDDLDVLIGGPGNDYLASKYDFSLLDGGRGDDTLDSSARLDVLIGGPGRDTFDVSGATQAKIMDFQDGVDKIKIATRGQYGDYGEGGALVALYNLVTQANIQWDMEWIATDLGSGVTLPLLDEYGGDPLTIVGVNPADLAFEFVGDDVFIV